MVTKPVTLKAARYFVPPELARNAGLDDQTSIQRIESHRLPALILEDVTRAL